MSSENRHLLYIRLSCLAVFTVIGFLLPHSALAFSGSGDGSTGSPYAITSCTQLQEMQDDLDAHYMLGGNIDCSDTINWNSGKGFDPIGWYDYDNDIAHPFTGTLNGSNYTVNNLMIIRANDTPNDNDPADESNVGLFGLTNGAIVSNINIANSKIKGHQNVGGIIGTMQDGQLLNSTFNATTAPNDCNPGHCVWARYGYNGGGLVGYLFGGEVANSHTAGSVRGSGSYIGGLVGSMEDGNLHDSYSTASADGGSNIGGAIGYMQGGTASHIYATGMVHAVDDELPDRTGRNLGGLIGTMIGGEVTNAYATGAVNADIGSAGGFVGNMGGGVISNAYSTGTVTSATPDIYYGTGGFAGDVYTYGDILIQNSFSVSSVNSTQGAGGFIGLLSNYIDPNASPMYPEPLVNVYYDVSRSGMDYCYSRPSYGTGNGEFSSPTGVTSDTAGNVYVVDYGNNRIQKFDSSGNYLTQWGSYGNGNGEFEFPYAVMVDTAGNVYVADTGNNRIQKFTNTGTYVSQWGTYGTGNGEFSSPTGVASDTAGDIYVADSNNNRIQKFTNTGTYVSQWGTLGSGNGEFSYPYGVTTDTAGNVYVADSSNNRIQKFTSSGSYIYQISAPTTGNTGCNQVNVGSSDPDYFYDYVNNPFTISGTRTWPANVWSFSGDAYPVFCDNNNCQSVLPPNLDNDGDGITNGVEDAGPNGGDGNNDGILDALQANVTTYTSQYTNGYVTLVGPNGSQFTAINSQVANDANYLYPFGLVGFTLSGITPGSTVQITLLVPSTLDPSSLFARKYYPNNNSYDAIPNASVSTTSIASTPTIQLSYNITDGSGLDLDGAVNGSITDLVGLATEDKSGGLANTGGNMYAYLIAAMVLAGAGVLVYKWHNSIMHI